MHALLIMNAGLRAKRVMWCIVRSQDEHFGRRYELCNRLSWATVEPTADRGNMSYVYDFARQHSSWPYNIETTTNTNREKPSMKSLYRLLIEHLCE